MREKNYKKKDWLESKINHTTMAIHVYLLWLVENGFRTILNMWPTLTDPKIIRIYSKNIRKYSKTVEYSREHSKTVDNSRIQSNTVEYSRIQSNTFENIRKQSITVKTLKNTVSLQIYNFFIFIIAKIR